MNVIEKIHKYIYDFDLRLKIAAPNRLHQLNYKENQSIYGIYKSINFYNNSSNDQYKISCKLNNDFYEKSYIFLKIQKTSLSQLGVTFKNFDQQIFEGSCEETNEIFEALKKEFYDPHVKIPVPPKQ